MNKSKFFKNWGKTKTFSLSYFLQFFASFLQFVDYRSSLAPEERPFLWDRILVDHKRLTLSRLAWPPNSRHFSAADKGNPYKISSHSCSADNLASKIMSCSFSSDANLSFLSKHLFCFGKQWQYFLRKFKHKKSDSEIQKDFVSETRAVFEQTRTLKKFYSSCTSTSRLLQVGELPQMRRRERIMVELLFLSLG